MLENEYYENVAHVGEGHQAALVVILININLYC